MWQERYPGLWSVLQLGSAIVLGTLLWLLFSLPLLTLPAATAGLYAVAHEAARGLDFNLIGTFWDGLRRRWRTATGLWWLSAALAAVLGCDAWFFLTRTGWVQVLVGFALSLLLLLLVVNLYAWPLLVRTDLGLRPLLRLATMLGIAHLFRSLGMVAGVACIVYLALRFPVLLFIAAPGAIALLTCWGTDRTLRRYLTDDGSGEILPPGPRT